MLVIQGEFKYIEREKHLPPKDGVHRVSNKDGYLKGCHCVLYEGVLVPKGQVGFYWRLKDNMGIKVFYSLNHKYARKLQYVKDIFNKMNRLHAEGICVKPEKFKEIDLDIMFRGTRHKARCWGIKVQNVEPPAQAWANYAKGIPYDFNCLDIVKHPEHCASGFIKFQKHVKDVLKKTGIKIDSDQPSLKLGDLMYCIHTKRWWLVDVG